MGCVSSLHPLRVFHVHWMDKRWIPRMSPVCHPAVKRCTIRWFSGPDVMLCVISILNDRCILFQIVLQHPFYTLSVCQFRPDSLKDATREVAMCLQMRAKLTMHSCGPQVSWLCNVMTPNVTLIKYIMKKYQTVCQINGKSCMFMSVCDVLLLHIPALNTIKYCCLLPLITFCSGFLQ